MFAGLLLLVVTAGVPQLPHAVETRPAVAPMRELSSAIRPAEIALVGVIERFEAAERRLVLRTPHDGRVTFFLATGATIRMGSRLLSVTDLSTHQGRKAKVRFTISGGRRTAHWIVVSTEAPKTIA